ncbi:MAG: endonuclease/exonuclease/phosphatase family protein [Bacteroidales bacterium]|nr:endonuclease/exonuclease/phosphatase family protein [Bacteroidales bacterium]
MKLIITTIVWFWALGATAQEPLELITYNIRMNTPGDGEHAWPNRKKDVVSLLRFHRAAVFCVQEALPDQVDDLVAAFPDFSFEGVGRDDGIREGEFSAVFFDQNRFNRKIGGTFWLSDTPEQCSFGWDAACRRVCTWVKLEEKTTGKLLFIFNTHFDHVGEKAREESAGLILRKIREIAQHETPVVLCGDFNLTPESTPVRMISKTLKDAYMVSSLPPHGSVATFHGFTYDDPPRKRIDYVFVSDGINVQRYGGLTDSRDRAFFSDHLPVLVTLEY